MSRYNRNLFLSAPADRSGAAGGMQGTARVMGQTAGSVSIALLFSVSAAASPVSLAPAPFMALLAGLVSLLRICSCGGCALRIATRTWGERRLVGPRGAAPRSISPGRIPL